MARLGWVLLGAMMATLGHAAATQAPSVVSMQTASWKVAGSGQAKVQPLVRGDNAFVGKLWLEPGAAVPEHADPTEEYVVVLSGGGTMVLAGQTHELTAGAVVYMPAGVTASYVNGDQPTEILQVFAGPEPAAKYDSWAAE
jgi:quercetin dioxygenase-like cupin family protein